MRLVLIVVAGLLVIASLLSSAAGSAQAGPRADLADIQMEHISYGLGFYPGSGMRLGLEVDGLEADLDLIVRGFADALMENDPMVPEHQLDVVLKMVHDDLQQRRVDGLLQADPKFRELFETNLANSRAFHEAFGARDGVVTLPDGAQYVVVRPGTGATPAGTDTVVVNVRMMLIDGTELGDWEGAKFRVDKLIEGGAQVLPRMKVGATWVAAVPPVLAFGTAGRYPDIGPNETIMFGVVEIDHE